MYKDAEEMMSMKRKAMAMLLGLLLAAFAAARAELTFEQSGYDPFTNTHYAVLAGGTLGNLQFERAGENSYWVSDGQSTLRWNAESICEEGFQSFAMPESLHDVREMNRVTAYLNDEPCVERRERAAFLRDGMPDDRLWAIPLTLTLREDAAMTDDPYGSCREIQALQAGGSVTCLGYFDALWALIETRMDGELVRGFIPLRALAAPQETPLEDVAARVTGRWLFFSGGELLGMRLEFAGAGTLISYGYDDGEKSAPVPYMVYAAPGGRYDESVPYVLVLTYADGTVARYGLNLLVGEQYGGEALSLRRGYTGGGYYRERQVLPPRADGDWG